MPRLNEVSPAQFWIAITTSDSSNLAIPARAIYVGTGGNIAAVGLDDHVEVFKNAQAGTILPITVKRVNATNTTAADLVALI